MSNQPFCLGSKLSGGMTSNGFVYVVGDEHEITQSLVKMVRSQGLNTIQCKSGFEFLEQYNSESLSCLIANIQMPKMNGLQLQQEVQIQKIRIPIIFFTAQRDVDAAATAMRMGAIDVVVQPFGALRLLERVYEALAIDQKKREYESFRNETNRRIGNLTIREHEIMQYLAEGWETKQIANRLRITSKTVNNHCSNILRKMQVDNIVQLARMVGVIDREPEPRKWSNENEKNRVMNCAICSAQPL